jgi:hypothetical protein
MAAPRIRRVETTRELQQVREDLIIQGYEVLREGEGNIILMRVKTWGSTGYHVVIALLTVWYTLGIPNVIYALVAHNGADQVLIKLEGPEAAPVAAGLPEAAPAS